METQRNPGVFMPFGAFQMLLEACRAVKDVQDIVLEKNGKKAPGSGTVGLAQAGFKINAEHDTVGLVIKVLPMGYSS